MVIIAIKAEMAIIAVTALAGMVILVSMDLNICNDIHFSIGSSSCIDSNRL